MPPGRGYQSETDDELYNLSVFHEDLTQEEPFGNDSYPIVRVGAFDYCINDESRKEDPLLLTAACADLISLRKGNLLTCRHGTGVIRPPGERIGTFVGQHTDFAEDAHCVNYITMVRVFGNSVAKWNVKREDD